MCLLRPASEMSAISPSPGRRPARLADLYIYIYIYIYIYREREIYIYLMCVFIYIYIYMRRLADLFLSAVCYY